MSIIPLSTSSQGENPPAAPSNQEVSELLRQFNEISQKVRSNPEVHDLEAKVEEAQKAYTLAYEQAIEKEAPQLLDKIRRLQRDRLQAFRNRTLQFPLEYSEDIKLAPEDRARMQKVRALAYKEADVIHYRQKVLSASNEEEREKAETEYQKVLLDTLRRIDPEIDQVLKKLKPNAAAAPESDEVRSKKTK